MFSSKAIFIKTLKARPCPSLFVLDPLLALKIIVKDLTITRIPPKPKYELYTPHKKAPTPKIYTNRFRDPYLIFWADFHKRTYQSLDLTNYHKVWNKPTFDCFFSFLTRHMPQTIRKGIYLIVFNSSF